MTTEQTGFLTALYMKRRRFLLEYAASVLGNHALAEEAVQITFVVACWKIEEVSDMAAPEAWLVKVLAFVTRYMLQDGSVDSRARIANGNTSRFILLDHSGSRFVKHLMNSTDFQMIFAIEVEGKSLAEIADDFSIHPNHCEMRFETAKKRTAKIMSLFIV